MLKFDAWQRCETVKQLLRWALREDGARILDVGGYPGRMRTMMPEHEWILCDPLVDSPGDQVRGSGSALPFRDDAFDFAVSLDVLEHIAPDQRTAVLDEMVRVSRQGMALSFPHNGAGVKEAEDAVREAHQRLHGKPHPWLEEHALFDLPDSATLTAHLRDLGGESAIFHVGALHRWTYLQLLDELMSALPNSLDYAQRLDRLYEERLFAHEFKPPAYRVIVLHLFDATEPLDLQMIETARDEESLADMALYREATMTLLELLLAHRAEEDALKKGSETIRLEKGYAERLEQGIRSWEEGYGRALAETRDAYEWRDRLERRFSFRVYRRLMRLLGRKI